MPSKKHDDIARRIARKKRTQYHEDMEPDIVTPDQFIQVEVPRTT